MTCYLDTGEKTECTACGACASICPSDAIRFDIDGEGFVYPIINYDSCTECSLCREVCPSTTPFPRYNRDKYVYGGFINNPIILNSSTSGGAFTAIAQAWCDTDYVIFGAKSDGLETYHDYTMDLHEIGMFQKSKYSQSLIGDSFVQVRDYLRAGKKVLFSGTPCQIEGLRKYLMNENSEKLLTVEVLCQGIPSKKYIQKINDYCIEKYGSPIQTIDYRYKDYNRWDFEVMMIQLKNGKTIKKDRWFNPFWSIWLQDIMSRPSCYHCKHTQIGRVADISLGDLWGVHLYCPELYNANRGTSLILGNTPMGIKAINEAANFMTGHELNLADAVKYQSPLRCTIKKNEKRSEFLNDLDTYDLTQINKKWAKKPTFRLLVLKYVWGNRRKVFLWNMVHRKTDTTNKKN